MGNRMRARARAYASGQKLVYIKKRDKGHETGTRDDRDERDERDESDRD